jgi:hypothetical protein
MVTRVGPFTVVAAGFALTAGYFVVAFAAFTFGGRAREAGRELARLAGLPFLAGLGLGALLALNAAMLFLLGLVAAAGVALLPPALAVASTFDEHAVEG